MAIYSRFGCEVEIIRQATDKDYESVSGDYDGLVVARYLDNGEEQVHHISFLRADDGWSEIEAAIKAAAESQKI